MRSKREGKGKEKASTSCCPPGFPPHWLLFGSRRYQPTLLPCIRLGSVKDGTHEGWGGREKVVVEVPLAFAHEKSSSPLDERSCLPLAVWKGSCSFRRCFMTSGVKAGWRINPKLSREQNLREKSLIRRPRGRATLSVVSRSSLLSARSSMPLGAWSWTRIEGTGTLISVKDPGKYPGDEREGRDNSSMDASQLFLNLSFLPKVYGIRNKQIFSD